MLHCQGFQLIGSHLVNSFGTVYVSKVGFTYYTEEFWATDVWIADA